MQNLDDRIQQLEERLAKLATENNQQSEALETGRKILHGLIRQNQRLIKRQQYLLVATMFGFFVLFVQVRFQDEDVDQWIERFEKIATLAAGLGVVAGGAGFLADRKKDEG